MVALAPITNETPAWDVLDTFPKLHSRAREAMTPRCTEAPHSKSLSRVEIWLMVFESCDGLESFTRDPIELQAGGVDLYKYVYGRPLTFADPTGNAIWIVGPEAATVSFIKKFSPTHDDFWRFYDESRLATGNSLQPGDLFLVMALLEELAKSANPDPATSYATWQTLLRSKEFRGFGRLKVEIECSCGGVVIDYAIDSETNHGFTPIRLNEKTTIDYEPGNGSSSLSRSKLYQPCLTVKLKHEFRIGWVGRFISELLLGVGVPFAWADFEYKLCCDKTNSIDWSGSNFPTHWAYLDKVKVGGRNQSDLAGFVFRTPNARANGRTFHSASGAATEVIR